AFTRGFDHVSEERREAVDLRDWRRRGSGGRIEARPTHIGQKHLDPGVSITLTHGVEATEAIPGAADEPRHVARGYPQRAQHHGHARRVKLAVAAARLEQKVLERVARCAGRALQ